MNDQKAHAAYHPNTGPGKRMSTLKFVVQCSPLSGVIHAGRSNKAGTAFTDKADVTGMVFLAVADFAAHHHSGHMYVTLEDGRRVDIDVTTPEEA